MQLAADIEQRAVRLPHRLRIVHELRDRKCVQDLRVSKAASRVLQVGLEQERRIPGDPPARRSRSPAVRATRFGRGGPPQIEQPLPQRAGHAGIARDVADGEEAEQRLHVVLRDPQRLVRRAHRVIEPNLAVPDRIPQRFGDVL